MEKKGSALYLCPGCGAFVSEDASKCPNCGEVLDGAPPEDTVPEPEEQEIFSELELTQLEEATSQEDSKPVTLFLCSACGAFTGGSAETCPNCGASMREDEETEPQITSEQDTELLDMLVRSDEPENDAEQLIDDLKRIESAEDVESFIESIPFKDPDRVLESDAEPGILSEDLDEDRDILKTLQLISEPSHEESKETPAKSPEPGTDSIQMDEDHSIAMCESCGAFVSESADVCNICGTSLRGGRKSIPTEITPHPDDDESTGKADMILRSIMRVSGEAELDKDAGSRFQSDGSLNLCTLCGAFISEEAESCPVCGTHIEDMPEFVPSVDVSGPEKDSGGLALCPHCGAFVQEGAKECFSCVKPIPEGAILAKYEDDVQIDEADKASTLLKTFLGVEKMLEMAPVRDPVFSGMDLCPDCGAFVSAQAVVCSVCGNPLFEGADEMQILEHQIALADKSTCPNCGAAVEVDQSECKICGMAFGDIDETAPQGFPVDISEFLDTELEKTITTLEEGTVKPLSDIPEQQPDEDLLGMLVPEDAPEETTGQIEEEPKESGDSELQLEIPEPELQDVPQGPAEPLEFKEEETPEPADEIVDDYTETYIEAEAAPEQQARADLTKFDTTHIPQKPANWATGVYVSMAAISFFIVFYLIVPGDYAPGLAIIFGTLLMMAVYLGITDRGTLMRGDLKHASVFFIGTVLAAIILLHWPLGAMNSAEGFMGQPNLDRMLLAVSILLIGVGLLWIRARVRYVFAWCAGTLLLFLVNFTDFTYAGFPEGGSPVTLVFGLGAGLVSLSFIMLQYERALQTSIESDIVRGDAHYLKRDYRRALNSYDDALTKAQMKNVEVLGSPAVQYDIPWYSKGSALILMGQVEEGIKCLDMALAINPDNEVTWVNKGNAHSKLGDHAMAAECYRRAIESNPRYEIAWNNLGNVHARKKEYLEALKHYNRAIKINKRYDDAWINKGYVLSKMGKREQAIECLNHVGSRAKGQIPKMDRDVSTI